MSTSLRVSTSNVGGGTAALLGGNTTLGDMYLPRQVVTDFNKSVLQKVIDVLNLWEGEWFLDTSEGFPWAQQVFGTRQINAAFVGGLLTQTLLRVPGVATVTASASFNGSTRNFTYNFQAKLNSGALITGSSSQTPLIAGG